MNREYIHTTEGRIRVAGSNYYYDYYLKDHLGNTRVVFTDENNDNTPEVLQVDNYYPFGMRYGQANTFSSGGKTTQYMYNGKELQEDFNLDWYDYGARMYDAALGRWHVMDPVAENYIGWSPYNYALNNPIRFVDPDGALPEDVINKANEYLGTYYEWGGKDPDDRYKGYSMTWLGSYYSNALRQRYDYDGFAGKSAYYKTLGLNVANGKSFGIDCSGLAAKAFNADPDKLMEDLKPYDQSANDMMIVFEDAKDTGNGELHSDLNNIKKGDLFFRVSKADGKAKHVMVATGMVKVDIAGNVVAVEVIHAPTNGKTVTTEDYDLRTNKNEYKVGHTKRWNDDLPSVGSGMSWSSFYNWVSLNNLWNKFN
jgi:RHS repeat-associated protein